MPSIFYLAGIVITFFLAFLLFSKKRKTRGDKILTGWLSVIGVHLTLFYLYRENIYTTYPFSLLLGFEIPLPLLHAPLLYLYTEAITNQVKFKTQKWVHFLPFIIAYIICINFLFLPPSAKAEVYRHFGKEYQYQILIIYGMTVISGIIYIWGSLSLLNRHQKKIKEEFSFTEKINLLWLRYLIYSLMVIWGCVLFTDDPVIYAAVVIFVFFLGFFGIKQVGVFSQQYVLPVTVDIPTKAAPPEELREQSIPLNIKYQKSGLTDAKIQEIHTRLEKKMTEEKLYCNPELSLKELAEIFEISQNNLSQVINTVEGASFYDYVNKKRVAEFQKMVTQPSYRKFTLLGIAYECGFNSKSSFNRNFKQCTGLSPTEFLRQHKIELSEESPG